MASINQPESAADISVDEQIAKVFEWRRGFNAMHLIDLGVQLGLFNAFVDQPGSTAGEVAERLGLHTPYVETWCTTAYSFGLLEGDEDRVFKLAPHMDQLFGKPGHPRYLGGYVRLGTQFATEDHRYCVEAFRTGAVNPFQGRSEHFAQTIADSTLGLQVLCARKLLPELPGLAERLESGGCVLELGCGAGQHLLQLAKAFPSAHLVGVDIDPTGLKVAREAVAKAGIADRVSLLAGDLATEVPAQSADAVVMVEVLHEIGREIRPSVIKACHRALKPGGWLLIVDETYPETLQQSREPDYLFPVQTGFEELTWGNVIPDRPEQEALLSEAGFVEPVHRSIVGEGFTILSVQKSQA